MFQFELRFLEDGGTGIRLARHGGASYVFEGIPRLASISMMLPGPHRKRRVSTDGVRASYQFRGESAPCRFIPLTQAGRQ